MAGYTESETKAHSAVLKASGVVGLMKELYSMTKVAIAIDEVLNNLKEPFLGLLLLYHF